MSDAIIKIEIQMTKEEAYQAALFFKRATFETFRQHTISKSDDETYLLMGPVLKFYSALRDIGIDPR